MFFLYKHIRPDRLVTTTDVLKQCLYSSNSGWLQMLILEKDTTPLKELMVSSLLIEITVLLLKECMTTTYQKPTKYFTKYRVFQVASSKSICFQ